MSIDSLLYVAFTSYDQPFCMKTYMQIMFIVKYKYYRCSLVTQDSTYANSTLRKLSIREAIKFSSLRKTLRYLQNTK
jgi:hypothetical protein